MPILKLEKWKCVVICLMSILLLMFSVYSYSKIGFTKSNVFLFSLAWVQFLIGLKLSRLIMIVISLEIILVGFALVFWAAITLPDSGDDWISNVPSIYRYLLAGVLFFLMSWASIASFKLRNRV